jgi:3'-phosphoadenosine 5'-phosphosulfate sulfotransferase (PAPS reductase)/FAD synthetase
MKIEIRREIRDAKQAMFFCSFGKDSSALLHALWPYLDKIVTVFIDCGDLYPDIIRWARTVGKRIPNFLYFQSPGDYWEEVRQKGFATDIGLPELGPLGEALAYEPVARKHKIRPWIEYVYERYWVHMMGLIKAYGADVVITGERRLDRPAAVDWTDEKGGVTVVRPLLDWTDEDVWGYIDEHKIPLAPTFRGRQPDRRDCYACMGSHDFTPGRIKELKEKWPELYHKVFVTEGFGEVLPVMVRLVRKKLENHEAILRIVEGRD